VDPRNPIAEAKTGEVRSKAGIIGVEIHALRASTEGEIDTAFANLAQRRTGALLVSNEAFFNARPDQMATLAARYALPTIYTTREFPMAGGLMSYGYSFADVTRLSGLYAARILKGERPADLPVIQTAKIELVINLTTAKQLGLTLPASLLARADELIE
jgi:putative ABC transport system substrate-binding protein